MDIKEKVGYKIRKSRKERGWSQMELAGNSGLDRTYIASVESGKRNISIINLEKISKALGLPLKQLFDDSIFE